MGHNIHPQQPAFFAARAAQPAVYQGMIPLQKSLYSGIMGAKSGPAGRAGPHKTG